MLLSIARRSRCANCEVIEPSRAPVRDGCAAWAHTFRANLSFGLFDGDPRSMRRSRVSHDLMPQMAPGICATEPHPDASRSNLHTCGDAQQSQPQRIQLQARHDATTQLMHQLIGNAEEDEPELVGVVRRARQTIRLQPTLEVFDPVFFLPSTC